MACIFKKPRTHRENNKQAKTTKLPLYINYLINLTKCICFVVFLSTSNLDTIQVWMQGRFVQDVQKIWAIWEILGQILDYLKLMRG